MSVGRTAGARESSALHAYAVATRAANRAWNARVKAGQQLEKADLIYHEAHLKMRRAWKGLSRVQRKEKGGSMTKDSQDRLFRQCMDELERRDRMDLEELIERANQKRKKEK